MTVVRWPIGGRLPAASHRRCGSASFAACAYLAWSLGNDRADFIAEQLAARQIAVARVRGMDGAVPVAANATDLDCNRIRRVEVWLALREAAANALKPISSATPASP